MSPPFQTKTFEDATSANPRSAERIRASSGGDSGPQLKKSSLRRSSKGLPRKPMISRNENTRFELPMPQTDSNLPSQPGEKSGQQTAIPEYLTGPLQKPEGSSSRTGSPMIDTSKLYEDLLMFSDSSTYQIADLDNLWPELVEIELRRETQSEKMFGERCQIPQVQYLDPYPNPLTVPSGEYPDPCSLTDICPSYLQAIGPQPKFSSQSTLASPTQRLESSFNFLNPMQYLDQTVPASAHRNSWAETEDTEFAHLDSEEYGPQISPTNPMLYLAFSRQHACPRFPMSYKNYEPALLDSEHLEASYYLPISSSATSRSSSLSSLSSDSTRSSSGYDSGIQCSPASPYAIFDPPSLHYRPLCPELPNSYVAVYGDELAPSASVFGCADTSNLSNKPCTLCPEECCSFAVSVRENVKNDFTPESNMSFHTSDSATQLASSTLFNIPNSEEHGIPIFPVESRGGRSPRISPSAIALGVESTGGRPDENTSKLTSPPLQYFTISPEQAAPDIHNVNPRNEKDHLLLTLRDQGISYKEIKARLNCSEAESTLRGRYRSLKKPKSQRLRKPIWTQKDVDLLVKCVTESILEPNRSRESYLRGAKSEKAPLVHKLQGAKWKCISEQIVKHGGSYLFGPGTCKKKYDGLVEEGIAPPIVELERKRQLVRQTAVDMNSGDQETNAQNSRDGRENNLRRPRVKESKVVKSRGGFRRVRQQVEFK